MDKTCGMSKQMSSDELALQIEVLFGVFKGRHELLWVQNAWQALGKVGLTIYKDENERQLVMIRLMVLATMYREFCQLAFNVCFFRQEETREWIQEGVVNRMRLWEMLGSKHIIHDERMDIDYLLVSHVCALIDGIRGEIFQALLNGYNQNKLALFEDMFRIGYNLEEITEVSSDEDDDYFEDYMNRAQRTLSWIISGMPRLETND